MELQVIKALEGTTQATVLHNGLGLIKRNVWMTLQLVERQLVNIYPKTVERIEKEAFKKCQNLKKVFVSRNTSIEENAFENCHEDFVLIMY